MALHIHAETDKAAWAVCRSPDTRYRDRPGSRNNETLVSLLGNARDIARFSSEENQYGKHAKRDCHYTHKYAPRRPVGQNIGQQCTGTGPEKAAAMASTWSTGDGGFCRRNFQPGTFDDNVPNSDLVAQSTEVKNNILVF